MATKGRSSGMVFLKEHNMIVEEAVGTRLFDDPPKREPCEITVADFDDTKLKVFVAPDKPEFVVVHIAMGMVGERLKVRFIS